MKQMSLFDYSSLSSDDAHEFRAAAERIKVRLKRTAEDIVEIGKELLVVKARLPHGEFGNWLKAEFDMADRSARNFMYVAEIFGGKTETVSDLSPKVLYALSAPSTPVKVRKAVLKKAEARETVSLKEIQDLKAETHKQKVLQPIDKPLDIFKDQDPEVTVEANSAHDQKTHEKANNEPMEVLLPDSENKRVKKEQCPQERQVDIGDMDQREEHNDVPVEECCLEPGAIARVEAEQCAQSKAIDAAQQAMKSLVVALASFQSEPDEELQSKWNTLSQTLMHVATDIQSFIEPRVELIV